MATLRNLVTSFIVSLTTVGMAASGLPMLSAPVSSGADYADRLASGNGVNGSPALVAQALYGAGRISQSSVQEAAEYLRNAEIRPCPQGNRQLSAVLNGSLGRVSRAYRGDETCLWDRNTQQVIGSASCGNIDLERTPGATPFVAERGERGPQGEPGYDGRDGLNGAQGPQGPQGERGPPGHSFMPPPPQGGTYDGYSGKELTRDLGHDLVWGWVTDRATGKLTRAWVEVTRIRASADIAVAAWNSQRGPESVTVVQQGHCNAAFNSSTNCRYETTTAQPVVSVPGLPGPPGRDGRDGQDLIGPNPIVGRPNASEPILERPNASEPVIGGGTIGQGGLSPRLNPGGFIGGSGGGEGTLPPRQRPSDPNGG